MQQGVGQTGQFCLLDGPSVSGRYDVDGGQQVRPGRWPAVSIFRPNDPRGDAVIFNAGLFGLEAVTVSSADHTSVICDKKRDNILLFKSLQSLFSVT